MVHCHNLGNIWSLVFNSFRSKMSCWWVTSKPTNRCLVALPYRCHPVPIPFMMQQNLNLHFYSVCWTSSKCNFTTYGWSRFLFDFQKKTSWHQATAAYAMKTKSPKSLWLWGEIIWTLWTPKSHGPMVDIFPESPAVRRPVKAQSLGKQAAASDVLPF